MKRRAGFTLTELLIVIAILLTLAGMTLAVYNTGRSSDRLRSAARVAQSALLAAKDKAAAAKNFRGVRITRDAKGWTPDPTTSLWRDASFVTFANGYPALASGFTYVQPISHDPYPAGTIILQRADTVNNSNGNPGSDGFADTPDVVIVLGTGVDWNSVSQWFSSPGQVRIPAGTGQWYQFTIDSTGPYAPANGSFLHLLTPYTGGTPDYASPSVGAYSPTNTKTNSCDIQFGNEVLPFHQPVALPAGVVIDLRYCSSNVQYLAGGNLASAPSSGAQPALPPNIDINFSPRGNVTGATGGLGALYFCLRDIADATANLDPSNAAVRGECLILALNPATGLVQTYDADLRDNFINGTSPPVSGSDGLVDNLFTFAQNGKSAGR